MSENFAKGCLPPKIDIRDYKLAKGVTSKLPDTYVVSTCPRVKNQGNVNSCVAHATSSILEYHEINDGGEAKLSTNFIYGIQKQVSGYAGQGMYLRDACKIVNQYGDMLESDCPGNDEVPKVHAIAEEAIKDSEKVTTAYHYKISSYVHLSTIDDIKYAIYTYGPVLVSIKWLNSFYHDQDGVLRNDSSKKGEGGYHAVMLYGWNKDGFYIQNSWGTGWGDKGRCVLSYDIPVEEAWQFIDEEFNDVIKPKKTPFLNIIYKIANFFINLCLRIFKK